MAAILTVTQTAEAHFKGSTMDAAMVKSIVASAINKSPRSSKVLDKYIEFMTSLIKIEEKAKNGFKIANEQHLSNNKFKAISTTVHPYMYGLDISKGILTEYNDEKHGSMNDDFIELVRIIISLLNLIKEDVRETDKLITEELNLIRLLYCVDVHNTLMMNKKS